jgi:hypothetical protein
VSCQQSLLLRRDVLSGLLPLAVADARNSSAFPLAVHAVHHILDNAAARVSDGDDDHGTAGYGEEGRVMITVMRIMVMVISSRRTTLNDDVDEAPRMSVCAVEQPAAFSSEEGPEEAEEDLSLLTPSRLNRSVRRHAW